MKKKIIAGIGLLSLAISGAAAAASIDPISPIQHGPLRDHHPHDDGTSTSSNWSGYAVTGTNFTDAKASWVVPTATCASTPSSYAAFWVGLDGYTSKTVEQTGTDSDCSGKTPKYYAWYEFYPKPSRTISGFTVKPGDKIDAEVSYSGSKFTLTITDETTGQTKTESGAVSGASRNSAEWIAEAPCCQSNGNVLPLSDFGTVDFGLDYTKVSSTNFASSTSVSGAISAFGSNVDQINMGDKSSGVVKASTSSLSSDGTSFTVTWKAEN